jgi:hypothetical protein
LAMISHYSKRLVRDMSLSEHVLKLFFSEPSLRTLQLRFGHDQF